MFIYFFLVENYDIVISFILSIMLSIGNLEMNLIYYNFLFC